MGATAYYCSGSLDSSTILAIFIASLRAVSCAAAIVFGGLWMVLSFVWLVLRQTCPRNNVRPTAYRVEPRVHRSQSAPSAPTCRHGEA